MKNSKCMLKHAFSISNSGVLSLHTFVTQHISEIFWAHIRVVRSSQTLNIKTGNFSFFFRTKLLFLQL